MSRTIQLHTGNQSLITGAALSISASLASALTGGTTGYIPLWASATVQSSSAIFQSSGNIGIGTTSIPAGQRLRIAGGDVGFEGQYAYFVNANAELALGASQNSIIRNNDSTNTLAISRTGASSIITFSTAGSERMRISSAGNVGIGTTNPNARLEINNSGSSVGNYLRINNTSGKNWELMAGISGISNDGFGIYSVTDSVYRLVITSAGNVGIGTTSPGTLLHVQGSASASTFIGSLSGNASTATTLQTARNINGVSFNGSANILVPSIYDANYRRITQPGGAEYVTGTSTVTGAIRVTLPAGVTNTMVTMRITVYEYTTNESFEIQAGGYPYDPGSNTWANNPFAYITGNPSIDRRFTVRFGHTGTQYCIYIGELASTWSYPQVFVTDVQMGYSNSSTWISGWSIGFEASAFQNVTATITNSQIGYQASTNTANSVVLRDGSGNFSAGTITATLNGAAPAGSLTGTTLASNVVSSSLTSVGTLSSLTVSGNVTVDTNTLFVDATNNRVGVGTAAPNTTLDVVGSAPILRVSALSAGIAELSLFSAGSADGRLRYGGAATGFTFLIDTTERMRLDHSGNLGLGVTPSAWGASYKVLQLPAGAISSDGTAVIEMRQNSRWTGAANVYVNNGFASNYYQYNSTHAFFTAPSGTAGNAITFTQAMTLDASGNLGIGANAVSPAQAIHVARGSGADAYAVFTGGNNAATSGAVYGQDQNGNAYIFNNANASIFLGTNATTRWRINSNGNLTAGTDNAFDIGASGALRPRDVFIARDLNVDGGTLYVDATNNRVGVGVTSTIAQLCNTTTSDSITGVQPTGFVWRSTDNDWAAAIISRPASGLSYGLRVHSGGTTASDFPLWISSGASTGTQLLAVNGAGNLGLGVTPSATQAMHRSIELFGSYWMGGNGTTPVTYLYTNTYYDGADRYKTSGFAASMYRSLNGAHAWLTAPSGTAGNAITFTQAMTLDASGNLGLGVTAPLARLHVVGGGFALSSIGALGSTPAAGTNKLTLGGNAVNGVGNEIGWYPNSSFVGDIAQVTALATAYGSTSAGALIFRTNAGSQTTPGERWRITSDGHFLAGVDNANDIGASGATRPRSIFVATSVVSPSFTGSLAGTATSAPYSGLTGVPVGIVSSSLQFNSLTSPFTGSFTGSFRGDGSNLINIQASDKPLNIIKTTLFGGF